MRKESKDRRKILKHKQKDKLNKKCKTEELEKYKINNILKCKRSVFEEDRARANWRSRCGEIPWRRTGGRRGQCVERRGRAVPGFKLTMEQEPTWLGIQTRAFTRWCVDGACSLCF